MKSVATQRQETELVVRLELRQANRAVGGGRIAAASDGGEGEERKRVDDRALNVLRRDSSVGENVRLRLSLRLGSTGGESSSSSGGVAEVAEAAAVEVAEEEAERDGGDDRDDEDENDDENARVHR